MALSSGSVIDEDPFATGGGAPVSEEEGGIKARVAAFEAQLIREELSRCGGNQSEAARRLKISRVTLIDKMKRYGLR